MEQTLHGYSVLPAQHQTGVTKKSTLLRTLFISAVSLFIFPVSGYADCKCPTKQGIKAALDSSATVVVGRVEEQRGNPLKPNFTEVKVTVLKRFKNDGELRRETLFFYTPDTKDACGISFQPGFEYLVFVTGNPAFYKTDACSRTEVLENAQVDIHRLSKLVE